MSKRNLVPAAVGIAIFSAALGCGTSGTNINGTTVGGSAGGNSGSPTSGGATASPSGGATVLGGATASSAGGKTTSSVGGTTASSAGGKTSTSSSGTAGSPAGGKTSSSAGSTAETSAGGKTGSASGGATAASAGGNTGTSLGGVTGTSVGGITSQSSGGVTGTAAGGADGGSGGVTGSSGQCIVPMDANTRREAAYPTPSSTGTSPCGNWKLADNVCVPQYCSNDNTSEDCSKCGGPGSSQCVAVSSKGGVSGQWPEVHCVTDEEPWHYSRSTHFGFTKDGACQFGYYGMCTTSDKFNFTGDYKTQCDAFCGAYPDLCKDPVGVSFRGNFTAPQGNYYTQFWPDLDGDRDNYLSCGECFQIMRTKQDGTEYLPGEAGYTPPIVIQVVDSCPCSANSKWCCGSGRDHCGEVISGSNNFKYGCPLPPGDLPPDHDPQVNESIHFDLGDVAMARLQSGDANKSPVDGVIPTKYKRVPCPVVGNIFIRLMQGEAYYLRLAVVNAADLGSITKVEAQTASGEWSTLVPDQNYSSQRPQERSGAWAVQQGQGPFQLPVSLRFTGPSGRVLTADGAIKAWPPSAPADNYYIDTGVQF